jgi:hypothetical protein
MENKNTHAFPAIQDIRSRQEQEFETIGGLTKHEYAAIMIASGFAAEYATTTVTLDEIAENSYTLAGKVLDQFK